MSVKIIDYDYTDTSKVTAWYYSSNESAYPANNLFDKIRRSKVWRSTGYFDLRTLTLKVIESSSDGGSGSELTATFDSFATALTPTLVAVKVAEALNAMPSAVFDYTCTWSTTTRKFTIRANIGGSYKNFKLLFSQSTAVAGILNYAASDTNYSSTQTSFVCIHQYEFLTWDFGTPINPDTFAAIGIYGKALKLSTNVTLKLQANTSNTWTAPAFDLTLEYGESGLAYYSETGIAPQAYRYWRLYIEDKQNINGFVELSNVTLGSSITFERGAVKFPFSQTNTDISETIQANTGQTHVNRRNVVQESGLDFNLLTIEDKEKLDDFWQEVGTNIPFFILFDCDNVMSTDLKKMLKYVKIVGSYEATLNIPKAWDASFSIREEI